MKQNYIFYMLVIYLFIFSDLLDLLFFSLIAILLLCSDLRPLLSC